MMQFDERLIHKDHVDQAIREYLEKKPQHSKARSAFLINNGVRLPAKFILRLAYEKATGKMPPSETLTGGRASVRVLRNLGFETIYEKKEGKSNRNPVKNERRRSFRAFLEKNFGEVELEKKFDEIRVPDLKSRITMDRELFSILEKIESVRGIQVEGQAGRKLAFDFYLPQQKTAIEFDERQHFTLPRAAAIRACKSKNKLGFDWERWMRLCEEINAGDNSPAYRDEQRAFYDAVRDVMAPKIGLNNVIRIYEDDVHWEKGEETLHAAKKMLELIGSFHTKGD